MRDRRQRLVSLRREEKAELVLVELGDRQINVMGKTEQSEHKPANRVYVSIRRCRWLIAG